MEEAQCDIPLSDMLLREVDGFDIIVDPIVLPLCNDVSKIDAVVDSNMIIRHNLQLPPIKQL